MLATVIPDFGHYGSIGFLVSHDPLCLYQAQWYPKFFEWFADQHHRAPPALTGPAKVT